MTPAPAPAPWQPRDTEDYAEIVASDGAIVAIVQRRENIPVVSAAPELLAALKALTHLDQRCGWHSAALDQSLAAIAKAEPAS